MFKNLDLQFPLVLRDCGKLFTWKNLLAFFPVHVLAFHLSGVVYCITRPANVAQLYAIVTKQRDIFRGWGVGKKLCAPRSTSPALKAGPLTRVKNAVRVRAFPASGANLPVPVSASPHRNYTRYQNKLDFGREIQKSKLHTQKISLEFHERKVY